jgi:hypothetical protein
MIFMLLQAMVVLTVRVGGENGQCSTKHCRMREEIDFLSH